MQPRKQKLFSTGEFAKLCGATKDTLFYYDRIGVLKPKLVQENGYRRYTAEQFFDYDLIRVLRQAGTSLQEIQAYLSHYDTGHFLSLFQEKCRQIAEQRRVLERMERMLSRTIAVTQRALSETYDLPRIERQPAETLLLVGLRAGDGDHVDRVAARLGEHFAQCERYGLTEKFPLGSVILQEDVLAGSEEESYFFSVVPPDFPQGDLLQKPQGTYATVLHRGPYDSFGAAYGLLLDDIRRRGLSVCGHAYVYDLVSYLASGSVDGYVMQISIQVSEPDVHTERSATEKPNYL